MKALEKFSVVFLVAGIGFFAFAGIIMGVLPWAILSKIPMKTVEELAQKPIPEFYDLAERYPEAFKKAFGEPNPKSFAEALRLGRDIYIAEGCWHCHSQYVRPVSNEDIRFGQVSRAVEYQNELNLPQLFGTRRVGPDLIREHGKRSNDWHAAHFYEPTWVVPTSVMPSFRWFFDGDQPNKKGLAIITYVQWLGSWVVETPKNVYDTGQTEVATP